jgi:hypothetical protein
VRALHVDQHQEARGESVILHSETSWVAPSHVTPLPLSPSCAARRSNRRVHPHVLLYCVVRSSALVACAAFELCQLAASLPATLPRADVQGGSRADPTVVCVCVCVCVYVCVCMCVCVCVCVCGALTAGQDVPWQCGITYFAATSAVFTCCTNQRHALSSRHYQQHQPSPNQCKHCCCHQHCCTA